MQNHEWRRLLWSTILHSDAWHLFLTTRALLLSGQDLERSGGSAAFAALTAELWATESMMYLGVHGAVARQLRKAGHLARGDEWYHTGAIGFSGVLFGMDTVILARCRGRRSVAVAPFGILNAPAKVCTSSITLRAALYRSHCCLQCACVVVGRHAQIIIISCIMPAERMACIAHLLRQVHQLSRCAHAVR